MSTTPQVNLRDAVEAILALKGNTLSDVTLDRTEDGRAWLNLEFNETHRIALPLEVLDGMQFLRRKVN